MEIQPQVFCLSSINVIILLSINNTITRQNVNAYINTLGLYSVENFQTNYPLGLFV